MPMFMQLINLININILLDALHRLRTLCMHVRYNVSSISIGTSHNVVSRSMTKKYHIQVNHVIMQLVHQAFDPNFVGTANIFTDFLIVKF